MVTFRPVADPATALPLIVPDPASTLTVQTYQLRLGRGEYRPEWIWVAEDGADGPPLAAGVWWGNPSGDRPEALDSLLVRAARGTDRTTLATELLTAAHQAYAAAGVTTPPAFHIFVPGDWQDRPEVAEALGWREEAARRAGLSTRLERLRYEWTPADGLPPEPARLTLRAEPDDEVFVDLFRRVLAGTLDATSRQEADEIGDQAQARHDVAFYRDKMTGDRAWWRVAATPDGDVVGFGLPSRNSDFPVVGYLGVLPGQRGHGYVDEILAGITRILAVDAGAEVIRADTDLANRPMAAAFDRAGYRNFARRVVLSAR